jgi:formate/nitrite transporter
MSPIEIHSTVKGPKEAYLTLVEKGTLCCQESSLKVFGQSFIAGCYIGFGALLAIKIAGSMPGLTAENPGLKNLIMGALFPVSVVLVLLTGGILFTTTTAAGPAAWYEGRVRLVDTFRISSLAWLGNCLGSVAFAFFTLWCELNDGYTAEFAAAIAYKKTSNSFDVTFARGVGCNWMVCMSVYLCGQAQDFTGKCVAIYLPISTYVMLGFERAPANFYLLTLAYLNGDISEFKVLVKNWIPATLGNYAAGAFIVAIAYSYFFGRLGHNRTPNETARHMFRTHASKSMGIDVAPLGKDGDQLNEFGSSIVPRVVSVREDPSKFSTPLSSRASTKEPISGCTGDSPPDSVGSRNSTITKVQPKQCWDNDAADVAVEDVEMGV